jgi:NTE family protein
VSEAADPPGVPEKPAPARTAPSAIIAAMKSAASSATRIEPSLATQDECARTTWPPQKLSLGLQGGGTFAAFTWGVLDRLLQEPAISFDAISGASAGAVNATLVACGWVKGGREGARMRLTRFWNRMVEEASFRSLMLLGAFSTAGSAVAFGPGLRAARFDPFDLDPLRRALSRDIDFAALRAADCPRLLVAATRVRDGRPRLFGNAEITADILLASTCPPLVHCAVEIDGEIFWDGGFSANPPLLSLARQSEAADLLVVQVTPSQDGYVPITGAAIDRRLDQIAANSVLNAEIAALQWARRNSQHAPLLSRIAAEDEIEGLAQRSATDLGQNFVSMLHRSGHAAAERWLRQKSAVGARQNSAAVQPVEELAV